MSESQTQLNAAQGKGAWEVKRALDEHGSLSYMVSRVRASGWHDSLIISAVSEADVAAEVAVKLNGYDAMREAAENLMVALTETALRTHGPDSCGCRLCEAFNAMKAAIVHGIRAELAEGGAR